MKLFAHSETPGRTPYVHLAYTAATTVTPQAGWGFTGLGFLLAGAVIAIRGVRGTLMPAPGGSRWWGVFWLCAGVLAIAGGVKLMAAARESGEERRQHPVQFTHGAMRSVEQEIRTAWERGIDIPRRTSEVDGWYKRILVRELPSQGGPTYELRSAGPDGRAGTDDDITHVVVVQSGR